MNLLGLLQEFVCEKCFRPELQVLLPCLFLQAGVLLNDPTRYLAYRVHFSIVPINYVWWQLLVAMHMVKVGWDALND